MNAEIANVNECPVFVSSADAYSDIWPAFFQIFRREWPEYRGVIYLNTETKDFSLKGLNIVCTKVGRQTHFGKTLNDGLAKVAGDVVLFVMIDYFFEKRVDIARLGKYYSEFVARKPAAFFLCDQTLPRREAIDGLDDCFRALPTPFNFSTASGWFSFQMAFWRKQEMLRLVAKWEDPWHAEFYGFLRTKVLLPEVWYSCYMPIAYDKGGVLHNHGRWLESALAKIDFSGIDIDFTKRQKCVPVRFENARIVLYDILPSWSNIKSTLSILWLALRRVLRVE